MSLYFVARFNFPADRAGDFKRAAARCLDATRAEDTGTLAYEWFMNDEQTEARLIEAYDSSDAVLAHFEHLGERVAALLEVGAHSAVGLGTPSAPLREFLASELAFLPRFQGLDAPRLADLGSGGEIRAVADFKIHPGKLEEFKNAAAAGLAVVAAKDPATSAYEWYLDEPGGRCAVVEMYRDADALLAHGKNVGHLMRALLQTCELSAALLTKGPPAALAPLARMPMPRFGYFQGLQPAATLG